MAGYQLIEECCRELRRMKYRVTREANFMIVLAPGAKMYRYFTMGQFAKLCRRAGKLRGEA